MQVLLAREEERRLEAEWAAQVAAEEAYAIQQAADAEAAADAARRAAAQSYLPSFTSATHAGAPPQSHPLDQLAAPFHAQPHLVTHALCSCAPLQGAHL